MYLKFLGGRFWAKSNFAWKRREWGQTWKKKNLWTLKFWEYIFGGKKRGKKRLNCDKFEIATKQCKSNIFTCALFFSLLIGATWYYHKFTKNLTLGSSWSLFFPSLNVGKAKGDFCDKRGEGVETLPNFHDIGKIQLLTCLTLLLSKNLDNSLICNMRHINKDRTFKMTYNTDMVNMIIPMGKSIFPSVCSLFKSKGQ